MEFKCLGSRRASLWPLLLGTQAALRYEGGNDPKQRQRFNNGS